MSFILVKCIRKPQEPCGSSLCHDSQFIPADIVIGHKLQIPEATLDELVRQVTDDPFSVKKIIADDGNTLHFHLSDGSVVTRTWTDRSRAESWTPEMKEKARQQSLARRRQKS